MHPLIKKLEDKSHSPGNVFKEYKDDPMVKIIIRLNALIFSNQLDNNQERELHSLLLLNIDQYDIELQLYFYINLISVLTKGEFK